MIYTKFTELLTQRLCLRKLRRTDVADFFRFAGSETVTKFMLWKPHRDISESAASIEKSLAKYEAGRFFRWGIALKETDRLIGIIDLLDFHEAENRCSFAYMLAEDCWQQGFGTEALTAVLTFAFAQMQLSFVEVDHMAENPASGAVMQKVGMTFLRTEKEKYEKNGTRYDARVYRITAEQWKSGKS